MVFLESKEDTILGSNAFENACDVRIDLKGLMGSALMLFSNDGDYGESVEDQPFGLTWPSSDLFLYYKFLFRASIAITSQGSFCIHRNQGFEHITGMT